MPEVTSLTFAVLDGIAFAASRDRLADVPEYSATDLGPLIEMLQVSTDELRSRAERIIALLDGAPLNAIIGAGQAQIGGGALPQSMIPSITIDLAHDTLPAQGMAARLRGYSLPVIGYIKCGKLRLDLRTIFPGQDAELVNAIRAVF